MESQVAVLSITVRSILSFAGNYKMFCGINCKILSVIVDMLDLKNAQFLYC